jgi:hypothetical protein
LANYWLAPFFVGLEGLCPKSCPFGISDMFPAFVLQILNRYHSRYYLASTSFLLSVDSR